MISSTLIFPLALTINKSIHIASDNACAYLWLTCFLLRSALLQTNKIGIFSQTNDDICFTHTAIELNEFLLSTLNTRIIPVTELYNDGKIILKF
jgi:hypothetical protein